MRSYLHIKGKGLWKFCAFITLAIVLACCGEIITGVDQPATATVGSVVPITVHINIPTLGNGGPDYLIFGFLVPKGWKGAQNTTITYTSPLGNGTMNLVPDGTVAKNGGGLTWPAYMKKTFQNGGNLIDDVEWVAYQSDKAYPHSNGDALSGDLHIKIKVGADGNNTLVKLGYVITDTGNGFTSDNNGTYYSELITPCFELTGGTGDLVDFCNPQLTTINPPKSLDNDFITLTFDGTVTDTKLNNATETYLCATAYTSDGKTISVCEQTDKTRMTQTGPNSRKYQITLWPKSFFGTTGTQTISRMEYFITDKTGATKVGYGNTLAPFTYTFKCS
ncbi:DUF4961 domain-containing protein [Mucilaginibacter sp. FT3.2]|uniref:DUF4961 domain-containing protein n=1 Tax=Mucilaginibacter sp. FT3.2 TaxID=2723090 RepID=UPI001612149A|nr:DUF4961 domain-containing protein [Mucilaginibacter sp. FT3.2]MBB6233913.1 hypothetical protein [Mucilaginibacter sp. FT3.2]